MLTASLTCITQDLSILQQEEEAKRNDILMSMGVTHATPTEETAAFRWIWDSFLRAVGLRWDPPTPSMDTTDKTEVRKAKVCTVKVQPKVHPEAGAVHDLEKGTTVILR